MNNDLINQLNNINKTSIIDFNLDYDDNKFGHGSIKVCTIKLINIKYQFIVCNTSKQTNELVFRYFDKIWSKFYQELNYINDSKCLFDLNNEILINNNHYQLLVKNYIKSIKLLTNNTLIINDKFKGRNK